MKKNILKQYQDKDQLEVGLDEAGRGCLFGPVCVAGVTWLDEDPEHCIEIRDSKKCTEKHRLKCYDTIIEHSKAYSIQMIDNDAIDKDNILRSSLKGMHLCLDEISKHNMIDKILCIYILLSIIIIYNIIITHSKYLLLLDFPNVKSEYIKNFSIFLK